MSELTETQRQIQFHVRNELFWILLFVCVCYGSLWLLFFLPPLFLDSSKCGEGGLRVKPKKGMCVLFYSLHEQGMMTNNVDPTSLHAGCDVLEGEKWAANLVSVCVSERKSNFLI